MSNTVDLALMAGRAYQTNRDPINCFDQALLNTFL